MNIRPTRHRLLPLAGLLLVTAVGASACGSDEPSPTSSGSSSASGSDTADALDGLDELADSAGVPEECRDAFPTEVAVASLDDVPVPDGWPEPPVDATLCRTSSMMDDSASIAGYATASAPVEVLDAYEAALSDQWDVTREDRGFGEVLTGETGDAWFQVETRDGAFDLTFGSA
ncbi:hypothetical protein GCM10023339_43910 [Alloalcanivorax gelatiniphagus]